jgi:hypothetical protein
MNLVLSFGIALQAIVLQTNCPKSLTPGTIVAAQAVSTQANYPVVILACYTLDPSIFTVNMSTSPPTITAVINGTGNFSDSETPSGTINGSNVTFTLINQPLSGTLHLFLDGLRMKPSLDYTISGSTITFLSGVVPEIGATIVADYRY